MQLYALYYGDKYIAEGTAKELAEIDGVQPDTIRFYATPAYRKRSGVKAVVKLNDLVKADLDKLRKLVDEHGYSRKDLSRVLNIRQNTLNQKMVGIIPFRILEIEELEDLFFLNEGELLKGVENE